MEGDSQARRRGREEVISRFRELSWQDQYEVYEVIQSHFAHSGTGSKVLREQRERADCVKAVQEVTKHLELPEGQAPGVQEYEQTRKALGLELSSATIIRRWNAWREVCKAARGERVSLTVRQRELFRSARKREYRGEEWLAGVREWLSSGASRTYRLDYDAWAIERNESAPHLPPVSTGKSVIDALVLPWTLTLRVARGELNLADAQAEQLAHFTSEGTDFGAVTVIALLHGLSRQRARFMTEKDTPFPAFAFKLRD